MERLLIRNGYLYPADDQAQVIPNGSVYIEDGLIMAAGPDSAVENLARARGHGETPTIEADGKLILPGFVNPHWHEMFATRLPFKGALRPPSDRDDKPAFMALGGDVEGISATFDSFRQQIDLLGSAEALAIARYSMWTQLRSGVTTLGDVGSFNRPQALAQAALDLGMRCVVSTWACDAVCDRGRNRFRRSRDTDDELSRIESVLREFSHHPSGLVRAWPTAVYGTNMTDELGTGLARLADRYEVPFATHVGALRNEAEVMRANYGTTPVRRFAKLGLLSERFMAIHCAFADEEERRMLVDANAHINHSPAKYGPAGEASLTETRAMPEFRRAGLDVSLSTDGSPMPVGGMAEGMRIVWQLYNEMYADPTEVLPTDALAMATRLPARGLDWADEIGSVEAGKRADLVLVPADDWRYLLNPRPLEGFLALGGSMDVDTVLVDGRVVLENGRSVVVDEEQLESDYLEALYAFSVRCLGIDPELAAARTRQRSKG